MALSCRCMFGVDGGQPVERCVVVVVVVTLSVAPLAYEAAVAR